MMKIVLGIGVWLLEAPKMPGTASVQDVYIFEVFLPNETGNALHTFYFYYKMERQT